MTLKRIPYSVYLRWNRFWGKVHKRLKRYYFEAVQYISLEKGAVIYPESKLYVYRGTGSINIGSESHIRGHLETQSDGAMIIIGSHCYVGDGTRVWAKQSVIVGDNVLIAHNCNIFDNDTHPLDATQRRQDAANVFTSGKRESFPSLRVQPVVIENDAWVGCDSCIMKGVRIGAGSIVASGSVVTKDVPDHTVVGGNPAKVLKEL